MFREKVRMSSVFRPPSMYLLWRFQFWLVYHWGRTLLLLAFMIAIFLNDWWLCEIEKILFRNFQWNPIENGDDLIIKTNMQCLAELDVCDWFVSGNLIILNVMQALCSVYFRIWLWPQGVWCFRKIYVPVSALHRNEVHLFIVFIVIVRLCSSFVLVGPNVDIDVDSNILQQLHCREHLHYAAWSCYSSTHTHMHTQTHKYTDTSLHSEMKIIMALGIYFLNSFS